MESLYVLPDLKTKVWNFFCPGSLPRQPLRKVCLLYVRFGRETLTGKGEKEQKKIKYCNGVTHVSFRSPSVIMIKISLKLPLDGTINKASGWMGGRLPNKVYFDNRLASRMIALSIRSIREIKNEEPD